MTRDDLPKGPLDIVPLSWKEHNHVQYAYEKNFAARIWRFRNLPGYAFMHRWAQKQISCDSPDYFNQLDESAVESLCENRRHIPTIRKYADLEQLFNELEAFD